ncbi:acyl carrier protein [Roseospira visakhapatnamensis]|uniref:Acyl carrier protein n=1 Tax=Roseospira visakhapatnamensis TaxID=390880 RepID=A0A7W6WA08_9PROT|nr:acyl carrier protein [Roseospira visakhapatnamensis]MBB4266509.1 acyl carrier protein [Roseospira visakhapatnamensis]
MTTSQERIETVVIDAIATSLSADPATINADTQLEDDLGVDSTELIGIIVEIEKALSISLKGLDYAKLKTPADLVAVITKVVRVEEPVA